MARTKKRKAPESEPERQAKNHRGEGIDEFDESTEGLDAKLVNTYIRNAKESPLLRLPGEIRNKIYEYAFGGHELEPTLQRYDQAQKWELPEIHSYNTKAWESMLDLTYTCRQIHRETRLLPFTLNDFQATDDDFIDWLEALDDDQKHAIKIISFGSRFRYEISISDGVLDIFYNCPGLTTVRALFSPDFKRAKQIKILAKEHCVEFLDEWEKIWAQKRKKIEDLANSLRSLRTANT